MKNSDATETFVENGKYGSFIYLFYEASISCLTKPYRYFPIWEYYKSVLLINTDAKMLNKMLSN